MALKIPKKRKKLVPIATARAQAPSSSAGKARISKKTAPKKRGELIALEQAIEEYGEDAGPMLHRLMHASGNKAAASPVTRLRDRVDAWANKEGASARFIGFAPGVPGQGELERTVAQIAKDLEQDRWTVLVFRPGDRPPVSFPTGADFPPIDCTRYEVCDFAKRFQPRRYWGNDFDTSGFEATVRVRWRKTGELPIRLDEILTALSHFGSYASQVAGVPPEDDAYLRALMEAARAQTLSRGPTV